MFDAKKTGPSMARRAGSIHNTLLRETEREKPRHWLWDPDDITGFGNKRLLRDILMPGKDVNFPRESTNEDEMEEIHDWLACLISTAYDNTVEVYQQFVKYHENWGRLNLHPEEFENAGYPSAKKYTWLTKVRKKNGSQTEKVGVLKVSEYVEKIFDFFVQQMENDAVFPADDFFPFPRNFKDHAKKLFTLLFRVVAIMLSNEHHSVHVIATQLKSTLKYILYASWTWKLIDEQELEVIGSIVSPIREQYEKDYAEETEHCTAA